MADLLKQLVSGVVDAAVKEVLKKTGIGGAATRQTRHKTTKTKASGGILADIIDAALNGGAETKAKTGTKAKAKAKKPAKKPATGKTATGRSAAAKTATKQSTSSTKTGRGKTATTIKKA